MKDSNDSLTRICTNEISLHNHLYIITMCRNNIEQSQIDIQVESKENGEQWKSIFNVNDIETMTAKTGNFKSFNVFVNMLENAINQKSSSVNIDFLNCEDLELLRHNQRKISSTKSSKKRYLILIYNAEFDHIYYPLSLRYCIKPDSTNLIEQIHQLKTENQLLKSRLESDIQCFDLQQECLRLKKENTDYRQQFLLLNSKEKDEQIEFLRQIIRTTEDALIQERINLQKLKTKKNDRYKLFIHQIQLLKTSERQLKIKVKHLTNQIDLLKKNSSPCNSQQRSTSDNQHRYRSSSEKSHVRFNPTAYIHEKNLKFRQIELEKKKETHRRLSSGRRHSESDISNTSLKSNELPNSRKRSSRKRTNNPNENKSKDSIDSDIEQISSPPILHKGASNNSTILFTPEYSHDNQNLINTDNLIDIDKRLKSLEKFLKQNVLH